MSGPLMDRIDLQIEVPRVKVKDLARGEHGESSVVVAKRVARARKLQLERQGKPNGHLGLKETERWCRPELAAGRLLEQAMERFGFSARAYHRLLRVARTIADLERAKIIDPPHVAEAVQYRALDRSRVRD